MGALAFDKIVQLQHNLTRRAKKPNTPNLGSLLQTKAKLDQHPHPTSKLRSLLQGSPAHNAHNAAQCTEEDENEDRRAAARFQQQERHYDDLKRRNGGRLSFAQSIEWDTIQMAERLRVKKRERELALERLDETEASQTLPGMDDAPEDEEQNAMHSDTEEEEIIEARKRKKIAMPRKEVKHQSLQEAEARSLEVALEGAGYGKKRKTGEGTAKARSTTKSRKSKPKPKSKEVKTAQPKKQRKSAKQKEEEARQLNQSTSLFTSDVFADQAPEDAAEQPVFTSTTKSEALAQLLSSVSMGCKNAAGADKRALLAATKDFDGRGSVKADGKGLWLVKGMKTSLKPYQVLGAAFMRRRENALEEPRGGLMADQMGLGKTLMTLANIVNGRSTDPDVKTTLLVASPSLLTQWHREIDQHTDRKWNIMRYGTGSRIDSNFNVKVFEHCDIILTTYHEVVRSYPKNKPPVELQTAEEKIAWWKKEFATKRGMLHRIQFYRIVLDEAQAIKNHTSRTSIACRALMARHRWALSGTPIVNGLEELYPYFKFLNVPYTGSLKIFKNNYCDSKNPENADRLLLKLNQFMIRRTHADTMFGAPILKLPKADQITLWCDFNPVERNIYEIVQKRFIERINSWSREGEIHKSYNNILVMLLRLRQLTAHVWMLELVMKDLLEQEDIEKIRDVVKHADFNEKTGHTIMAIRKQLEWYAKTGRKPGPREVAVTASSQDTNESQSHSNEGSGGNFGKDYDFKPYLDSLTSGESGQKREAKARCCAGYEGCTKGPKNLWLTACGHLYCEVCYLEAMLSAGEEEGNQCVTCMKCGSIWKSARPCDVEDDQEERFSVPTTGNGRQRVRADKEELKNDWISMCGPKLLPSTKTVAVKAQILNWIDENPNVKIIIYTWFLPMMRILSKVFEQEGWPTEQYHGKMSHEARDKALRHFADNDKIRVMLASIQCGGLGLNLTMASRVIIIDPWWNRAVEQQAFCRVFRIGQKETTFMTRFCVRNTVDERLIQMQDRKQKEIDEIMEDDGTRLKKLKMADLLRLFGAVVDGEGGKPFIMVDNAGTHGGFHADEDHEGYADEE
ncbi:hypothetical protein M011DRAFT_397133 [Sporormia fimetaria CBS 119925]|uniref:P-loop containing nucleoside triphosphate hydrolase protein n=1 Tax=Sporormia fimetaria CBS 119925 TaxID=1340428 RepID=A0A6A6VK57_9PLEO|nr:hypothetical protein M011DRAFT_397133 [Sporormia fimetaria CBS 119925]